MTNTKQQAKDDKPGILRRLFGIRGYFREQKEMAFNARHKQFLTETLAEAKRIKNIKVAPVVIESFDQAVIRNKLTPTILATQLRRFTNVHLFLYGLSCVLLVYALYLTLNFNVLYGCGALVGSLGAAVNGYLHGYRAWQIKNRNLIRLQDAIRNPDTYLVL